MSSLKNPWLWVPSLYFAEGLPNVVVLTLSIVMFQSLGLSPAEITFYTAWFNLPWMLKPIWSPFVDIIKTKRWWILAMQFLIGVAMAGVAFLLPTPFWLQATLAFLCLTAFSSATHDIAADGFYMLGLQQQEQSFFVGIRNSFYRLAVVFGRGFLVMLAGLFERVTNNTVFSWCLIFYLVAAIFIALWLLHSKTLPKPKADKGKEILEPFDVFSHFLHTLKIFFNKPFMLSGLLFIVFYRMPEGLLSPIVQLFMLDSPDKGGLGLTKVDFGLIHGIIGVVGLLLGGIVGGIVVSRHGLKRWLWPMAFAISLPDVLYVYLSFVQSSNLWLVASCVAVEQFGYGFGFTSFMLYLIYYSQGEFKTSHYALCTAFMTISLFLPGLFAGWLQSFAGYRGFFIIVMISTVITFMVTALVRVEPTFGKKQE